MKIAVLTGGSDVPGLNAVIRAVVRTAVYRYADDVVGVVQGWEGLLRPPEVWTLAPGDVVGMVRRGGTILGSANRGSPFAADGGDRSGEVLESIRWLGVDGVICIGGDGSLAIADRLAAMGVPIVGIPKAIGNDMGGTFVSFGYATAVEIATEAIDKLQTTREADHRVMYLEVTGRRSGWIAANAGISGGADVVLVPEVPYRPDRVADVIEERRAEGKPVTIVVAAEGAREVGRPLPWEDPEVERAGGAAAFAAARVHERCPLPHRVTVLGHLQRGGDPTAQDRLLATRFGAAAVQAVHQGELGKMVAVRSSHVTLVPLEEAVGTVRALTPDCETVWTALSMGMSLGVANAELEPAATT